MANRADDNSVSPRKRSGSGTGRSGEDVQRRTFTRWVNAHLMKLGGGRKGGANAAELVEVLNEDLRDGKRILRLLRALTGVELKTEKGDMRLHHITNINRALALLKDQYGLDFVNYNIGAEDLAGGSPRLTLGFVWRLILRFQVQLADHRDNESAGDGGGDATEGQQQQQRRRLQRQKTVDVDVKKELLSWCQAATRHCAGVGVADFRRSWIDGLAFLALLRRFRPDLVPSWPPPPSLGSSTGERATAAFRLAEDEVGVLALLDAEDLVQGIVDEQSMVTYLAMLREALGAVPGCEVGNEAPVSGGGHTMTEEAADGEPVAAAAPALKSDSGYRTEEGAGDDVTARTADDVMGESTDGTAEEEASTEEAVGDFEASESPLIVCESSSQSYTQEALYLEPASVEVMPQEDSSLALVSDAEDVPATRVTSAWSARLGNSPTDCLFPSQAELVDTKDESCSPSAVGGSDDVMEEQFGWWPWLGLIPLVVAVAFEVSR